MIDVICVCVWVCVHALSDVEVKLHPTNCLSDGIPSRLFKKRFFICLYHCFMLMLKPSSDPSILSKFGPLSALLSKVSGEATANQRLISREY